MTDFFINKQKKYWCDICRIFIEYNRITIEHHNNTSTHLENMKRGTKYIKMKREYNNYVKDLKEKQQFSSSNTNDFLGRKTYESKKNNNNLFNEIKAEMMQKELKIEKSGGKKWKVFYDKKNNHEFYFNFITGESQWDKPEDCPITEEEIEKVIEEGKKKVEFEKKKHKEGNVGKWEKIDRKTANKIFGKRQDDYYEKLEKMKKNNNEGK